MVLKLLKLFVLLAELHQQLGFKSKLSALAINYINTMPLCGILVLCWGSVVAYYRSIVTINMID